MACTARQIGDNRLTDRGLAALAAALGGTGDEGGADGAGGGCRLQGLEVPWSTCR